MLSEGSFRLACQVRCFRLSFGPVPRGARWSWSVTFQSCRHCVLPSLRMKDTCNFHFELMFCIWCSARLIFTLPCLEIQLPKLSGCIGALGNPADCQFSIIRLYVCLYIRITVLWSLLFLSVCVIMWVWDPWSPEVVGSPGAGFTGFNELSFGW